MQLGAGVTGQGEMTHLGVYGSLWALSATDFSHTEFDGGQEDKALCGEVPQ